ncbi:hypothetical protein VB618_15480 [Microvirga sp. CF3062]|uniref:hypothetical protein n=1 Tax=Microvirga sp. CF3062 TaxID=3110182 RepID=UPI002E798AB5|nr:hypothetical protein [Microvirga sp. CF3062]MEE1657607.1 hypothetical protein [Microvirga sp. CF3062]
MDSTKQKPSPAEAIYREARTARETSQQLLPLLSLVAEQKDEKNPLEEIQNLLGSILSALQNQTEVLARLEAVSASVLPSQPSQASTYGN